MKLRVLMSVFSVLVLMAVVASLPLEIANALIQVAPTQGGLPGFSIPTATLPGGGGGGFVIPTATLTGGGGGLVIPTATLPGGGPAPALLPVLSDQQLQALNLQAEDVPAEFAASQNVQVYMVEDSIAQLRQVSPDLADRLQQLSDTYNWKSSVGIDYTACQPTVPVSSISSEVIQLPNPDLARAFMDDPQVKQFFSDIGYAMTLATSVHGWYYSAPLEQPTCFAQETEYNLSFEYWGMLLSVSMTANADTDPAMINGLLDQLAPVLVARVNALAAAPFPSTPIPGVGPGPTPQPTANPPIAPTPANPVQAATLQDIQAIMPSLDEIGLPAPFALNQQISNAYTMDQIAGVYRAAGYTGVADAITQNAQRNGALGQVTYVFDAGQQCPQMATMIEIDITLFQVAQGAQAYLGDQAYLQSWIDSGLVSSFEPRDTGILATGPAASPCGQVILYDKIVVHGRFLVAISTIAYTSSDKNTVLQALDALNQYMVQKIDQAGLQ